MRVDSPRDLGLAVREERKRLGWSQEVLATRAGVSRWWITTLERGKPGAPVDLVLRTLQTLGLSVDIQPVTAPPHAPETMKELLTVDLDAILASHILGDPSP